jgi:hypothetical protein
MKLCLKVLMLCVSLLYLLAGCEKVDTAPSGVPKLNLSITSINFESSMKSSKSFSLTSTRDWTAICAESWVALSHTSGKASKEPVDVTVYVTKNSGVSRQASIYFTNNRITKVMTIVQPGEN